MPLLFTYSLADDGAASNPFYGMCSLVLSKPGSRKVTKPDDWIAGLGSKNASYGRADRSTDTAGLAL
jgi:hypothetical protein